MKRPPLNSAHHLEFALRIFRFSERQQQLGPWVSISDLIKRAERQKNTADAWCNMRKAIKERMFESNGKSHIRLLHPQYPDADAGNPDLPLFPVVDRPRGRTLSRFMVENFDEINGSAQSTNAYVLLWCWVPAAMAYKWCTKYHVNRNGLRKANMGGRPKGTSPHEDSNRKAIAEIERLIAKGAKKEEALLRVSRQKKFWAKNDTQETARKRWKYAMDQR